MNDEKEYQNLTDVIVKFMKYDAESVELKRTVNSLFYGMLVSPEDNTFNVIRMEAEKTTLVKLIKVFIERNEQILMNIKQRVIDNYRSCFYDYNIKVDLILDFDDFGSLKPTFFLLLVHKITNDRYNKYNLTTGVEYDNILRMEEDLHSLFKSELTEEIKFINHSYITYVDECGGLEKYNSVRTERKRV
jgi:hypothetical protein